MLRTREFEVFSILDSLDPLFLGFPEIPGLHLRLVNHGVRR